jgi:hypothetical protein
MIRKAVGALLLIPLAFLMVLLSIANRQSVTIALDPFLPEKPTLSLTQPLFLVVMVALTAGVAIGGVAGWLKQGRWRRTARQARAEAHTLRAETAALRERLDLAERIWQSSAGHRNPPAA